MAPPRADLNDGFVQTMTSLGSSVLVEALIAVRWWVLLTNVWALFLVYLYKYQSYSEPEEFDVSSFRVVGVAISFLLVHRTTVAYGYFWEAISAWAGIMVHIRALLLKICCCSNPKSQPGLVQTIREACALRLVMLATCQRLKLEECEQMSQELAPIAAFDDLDIDTLTAQNILSLISVDVHLLLTEDLVSPPLVGAILAEIAALDAKVTATDKLLDTDFPLPYARLLTLGILIFTTMIPTAFVADWEWQISLPTTTATVFLFGLQYLGDRMLKPFSRDAVSSGHPFFCMRRMCFLLQEHCWKIVDDATHAPERKEKLLSQTRANKVDSGEEAHAEVGAWVT